MRKCRLVVENHAVSWRAEGAIRVFCKCLQCPWHKDELVCTKPTVIIDEAGICSERSRWSMGGLFLRDDIEPVDETIERKEVIIVDGECADGSKSERVGESSNDAQE